MVEFVNHLDEQKNAHAVYSKFVTEFCYSRIELANALSIGC